MRGNNFSKTGVFENQPFRWPRRSTSNNKKRGSRNLRPICIGDDEPFFFLPLVACTCTLGTRWFFPHFLIDRIGGHIVGLILGQQVGSLNKTVLVAFGLAAKNRTLWTFALEYKNINNLEHRQPRY